MSGDAYRRAQSGQPVQFSAAAWNACLDAAQAHKNGAANQLAGDSGQFRQADIVLVKNDSGEDVPRFGVLGIDGVIFTADDNLLEFQARVAFTGVTPAEADHAGKFVICLDPIADGKIGRAWVSGVCAAKVNIASPAHRFADVLAGNVTTLRSCDSGTARIMYREGTSGDQWCVVRMSDGASRIRVGKTTTAWAKNTLATIEIYEDGSPPSETADDPPETLTDCVNHLVDVEAEKWVHVALAENGHWYLVAAEPGVVDVLVDVEIGETGLSFNRKTVAAFTVQPDPEPVGVPITECPEDPPPE